MPSTTEATYESAAKATRKTKRFAQRVRTAAAKARRATTSRISRAVRATGRAIGFGAKKTTQGVTYSAGFLAGAVWVGLRAVGKGMWALLSLVWTLVSTIISLVARAIAWLLSLVTQVLFAVGVAFAIISMLFGHNSPKVEAPAKPEYVMTEDDQPAEDHQAEFVRVDLQPEDLIDEARRENAERLKAQYLAAKEANDVESASYLFGRHQAAEAKISKVTHARGWAMVNKELKNPNSVLIRSHVKRGWDTEFGVAPRLTAVK